MERGLGSRRRRAHGLHGAVGDERGGHERLPLEDLGYVVGPLALGIASASVWKWRFNWRPLPKRWITATVAGLAGRDAKWPRGERAEGKQCSRIHAQHRAAQGRKAG